MINVLFVCLGNICRSPTAEGVFRALVRREGLQRVIATDSCGTSGWHIGEPPDARAINEAKSRNVDLSDLRSRKLHDSDFASFDYILGMDHKNMSTLIAASPPEHQHKCFLFLDFTTAHAGNDIPDPYYGGPDGFGQVFDLIEAASAGLLADIRNRHTDRLG